MGVPALAAWSVILGLALMMVGGLVLWAYGAGKRLPDAAAPQKGPEAAATRLFHTRLARWFFIYGILVISLGAMLLFWAGSVFF